MKSVVGGCYMQTVGKTASGDYQVGVRRTFPVTVEAAWSFMTSSEGVALWLGKIEQHAIHAGKAYETAEGTTGTFRVLNEHVNIRLTWQPPHWDKASLLQIRTIPAANGKTTISFHQEHLRDAECREEMKAHWTAVLAAIQHQLKSNE